MASLVVCEFHPDKKEHFSFIHFLIDRISVLSLSVFVKHMNTVTALKLQNFVITFTICFSSYFLLLLLHVCVMFHNIISKCRLILLTPIHTTYCRFLLFRLCRFVVVVVVFRWNFLTIKCFTFSHKTELLSRLVGSQWSECFCFVHTNRLHKESLKKTSCLISIETKFFASFLSLNIILAK